MQVVIDIDDERYKNIQRIAEVQLGLARFQTAEQIIAKGTPLPKGHGKLGDLDIILNKAKKHRETYMEAENSSYCRGKLHAYELYVEEVENAPTIIEADKAGEEG